MIYRKINQSQITIRVTQLWSRSMLRLYCELEYCDLFAAKSADFFITWSIWQDLLAKNRHYINVSKLMRVLLTLSKYVWFLQNRFKFKDDKFSKHIELLVNRYISIILINWIVYSLQIALIANWHVVGSCRWRSIRRSWIKRSIDCNGRFLNLFT